MSAQENKAVVRRLIEEVLDKRNLALVDAVYAPNIVDHGAFPGQAPGSAGIKEMLAQTFAAFSDGRFTIDDMVAEGDKVVTRWTSSGTHTGAFMGIAATGKRVTMGGIEIDRIAGGKIVETWAQLDMLGLLQQLGAVPAPA